MFSPNPCLLMDPNLYLPPALPLMSDEELARLKREYEAVHAEMAKQTTSAAENKRRLLGQALHALDAELRARGIEGEPWWVTRQAASPRPPRRMSHPGTPTHRLPDPYGP